jgi:hypothetical protein
MKKITAMILILWAFMVMAGSAHAAKWISTGELSRAHEKLEGITNCFKCHSLTREITDAACMKCHEKLNERIKANRGFHSNVEGKCVECHTEHKGRDHDITGLDKEKFDHEMTGYGLRDRHRVACDKCHKKEDTYLDLSSVCTTCHNDVHKQTLSQDCIQCHNYKGWKDLRFDHNRNSEYRLTGKHVDVKCSLCHPEASVKEKSADTEKVYQMLTFKPLQYSNCDDCHYDIHRGEVKDKPCAACHVESGWEKRVFDHSDPLLSDYELFGRHENVRCERCHPEVERPYRKNGKDVLIRTLKFKPVHNSSCSDCHFDVHNGQFKKQDCGACHSLNNKWRDHTFDHGSESYGGYKLEGRHEKVDCAKCHERSDILYTEFNMEKKASVGRFRPLQSAKCSDCHFDIHQGDFAKRRCDSCHSMNRPWKEYTFSHEPSNEDGFRLAGKHKGIVCEKCHERSEISYAEFNIQKTILTPRFRLLSYKGDCVDCHKEDHKERFRGIAEVREITCGTCHSVESEWKDFGYKHISEIKFKKYQLNYKAEESECEKCHTCGTEIFCTSCCVRRCMPCDFRQKILKSKDLDLYQLKNREP